ncbi:MAG: hypothetical protein P8170_21690 [Gemmatimonadota bacterium]
MFEDLRAAFREALDNFNNELRRENVSETADRLLVGMKNEIVDEKAQLRDLESQLERALAGAEREKGLGETCRRRETMARGIGDEETASLAAEHATKHEGHRALLEKKATAIREELDRMAEKIEGERRHGEAAEALGDLDLNEADDLDYEVSLDSPPEREELDVDAALAELKRRMGES